MFQGFRRRLRSLRLAAAEGEEHAWTEPTEGDILSIELCLLRTNPHLLRKKYGNFALLQSTAFPRIRGATFQPLPGSTWQPFVKLVNQEGFRWDVSLPTPEGLHFVAARAQLLVQLEVQHIGIAEAFESLTVNQKAREIFSFD